MVLVTIPIAISCTKKGWVKIDFDDILIIKPQYCIYFRLNRRVTVANKKWKVLLSILLFIFY